MGAWWMVLPLLAGCFSKPPRPSSNCGDAQLDLDEACDDGNLDDGDGCTSGCTIESWFECTAGEACRPVLALRWADTGEPLPPIGGNGGSPFELDCPAVTNSVGSTAAVVGLTGASGMPNQGIAALRAVCAEITLEPDGAIRWETPVLSQGVGNVDGASPQDLRCDADEVATGFTGTAGNFVGSVELFCQAITHRDGALTFGTRRKLDSLGPGGQNPQPTEPCPDNTVARALVGRAGAVVDQFTTRCVPTEQVICGDSKIVDAFETCDDGNAVPGDGCNARCDGD